MGQKRTTALLGFRKVFVTLIVAVMALAIVASNSNAEMERSEVVYTFSTPTNLKAEGTITYTDFDASGIRSYIDQYHGDYDNQTEDWEVAEYVEETEDVLMEDDNTNTAVNDVYSETTNVVVRMRDVIGPSNSTEPCTLELLMTATFDISAEYGDKYTFTYIFEEVPDEDTNNRTYIVPEGYQITSVTGFEDNTLSNGGRTISSKPIDDITFVFEKVDDSSDNDGGLGIPAPSLITGIISMAVIARCRRLESNP